MSGSVRTPPTVDRESPIPAYHQLARALRRRIERGDWTAGDQLPTELQLAEEYALSRSTVRQALTQLAQDRFVSREQGKGTFALEPPRLIMNDLSLPLGLANRSASQGVRLTTQVLNVSRSAVVPGDAGPYLTDLGPYVELSRRVELDGAPAAHIMSWLPESVVPGLAERGLLDGSLSRTLTESYGHVLGRYDNQLQVVGATGEQADLLDVAVDDPLLLLAAVCSAADGAPLEYSRTYWRADRVRFRFGVDVERGDQPALTV